MNRQRFCIANISKVTEELELIDKLTAPCETAYDPETYKCTVFICVKILLCGCVMCVAFKPRVVDPSH